MLALVRRTLGVSLLLVVAGCGADRHRSGADPAAFAALASDVDAAARRHHDAMVGAGPSGCAAEMARYAAEVRPMLDRMQSMSGELDGCMEDMGHGADADLAGTCAGMQDELEHHRTAGCGAADLAAEATRHRDAMEAMAARERQRADDMGGMMGSGTMPGRCGR